MPSFVEVSYTPDISPIQVREGPASLSDVKLSLEYPSPGIVIPLWPIDREFQKMASKYGGKVSGSGSGFSRIDLEFEFILGESAFRFEREVRHFDWDPNLHVEVSRY